MGILQRNKKAAAGIGVAALAVAAIALGTGTYAAFQDQKVGPSGTLAAGTLTLDVTTNPAGQTPLFSATNIAPGYVSPSPMSLTVKNSGSLPGKLNTSITVTPNAGGALQNYLKVSGDCGGSPFTGVPILSIPSVINNVPLASNQSYTCNFTFAFPDNGGNQNDAQGDKVDFTSNFTLTQA